MNEFDKKTLEEKEEFVDTFLEKLNKLREAEFGSDTASELWREKINFQILFYERLKKQIYSSRNVK